MLTQTGFHLGELWGVKKSRLFEVQLEKLEQPNGQTHQSGQIIATSRKGSFLEGNPNPLVSGRSRLVKYYLARIMARFFVGCFSNMRVSSLAGFKLFTTFRLRRSSRGGGGTVAILASWWYGALAVKDSEVSRKKRILGCESLGEQIELGMI